MGKRSSWEAVKAAKPLSEAGRRAYDDEARVSVCQRVSCTRVPLPSDIKALAQMSTSAQNSVQAPGESGGEAPNLRLVVARRDRGR